MAERLEDLIPLTFEHIHEAAFERVFNILSAKNDGDSIVLPGDDVPEHNPVIRRMDTNKPIDLAKLSMLHHPSFIVPVVSPGQAGYDVYSGKISGKPLYKIPERANAIITGRGVSSVGPISVEWLVAFSYCHLEE